MQRHIVRVLQFIVSVGLLLSACAVHNNQESVGIVVNNWSEESRKTKILHYYLADPQEFNYWQRHIDDFCSQHEQVTIEVKSFRGTDELFKELRIKQAIRQLPDIMQLKPDFIPQLTRCLYVWSPEDPLIQNNLYANAYAFNEAIYGVPLRSYREFVYYHKNIFKRCGLKLPETWQEFIALGDQIVDGTGGTITPLALGGRDAWTVYPFTEFMPQLLSTDLDLLDRMTQEPHPFAKASVWDESYAKVQALFRSKLIHPNALRTGIEAAQAMFEHNEAAMIALGQWYLPNYLKRKGTVGDLGVFALPVRQYKSEENPVMTMVDNFLCLNAESDSVALAKCFVEWSFSEVIYKDYLEQTMCNPTCKDINIELPMVTHYLLQNRDQPKLYRPGGLAFQDRVRISGFDCKLIGQWMLAGKAYRDILDLMNTKWSAAAKRIEQADKYSYAGGR